MWQCLENLCCVGNNKKKLPRADNRHFHSGLAHDSSKKIQNDRPIDAFDLTEKKFPLRNCKYEFKTCRDTKQDHQTATDDPSSSVFSTPARVSFSLFTRSAQRNTENSRRFFVSHFVSGRWKFCWILGPRAAFINKTIPLGRLHARRKRNRRPNTDGGACERRPVLIATD
jgi:hypothetical protein